MKLAVLDLFSGLGGWSAAFKDRGHEVVTLDMDLKFKADWQIDIMQVKDLANLEKTGRFDIILASPPCEAFSVAAMPQHHWQKEGDTFVPQDERALEAIALAKHTFGLIESYNPTFYVIENPRGMMRHAIKPPITTISYCQYGSPYMKPTDLWGRLPPSFVPKICKPRRLGHAQAPRSSKTGMQGASCNHIYTGGHSWAQFRRTGIRKGVKNAALRALIPYGLSLAMCLAAEKDLRVV